MYKLNPIKWLHQFFINNKRQKNKKNFIPIVIVDDLMSDPEDFKLSPEEYEKLYEEYRRKEEQIPNIPEKYKKNGNGLFATSWLKSSIDPKPLPQNQQRVTIVDEKSPVNFELDPEEYRIKKAELDKYNKKSE